MKRAWSAAAILVAGALALTGCAAESAATAATPGADAGGPGITARGIGTVTGTPDIVTVVLGVQTRDSTAAAALEANNSQATALLDVLRGAGVAPEDLQTSQLSIYPTYGPESGRITGYEVTNQVTATLRDIAGAGALIDAAAAAAGDAVRVQQLSFSIDDDAAPRAEARAAAVRQAQAQAQQLADAAGVQLGPIRSIIEVPQTGPGMPAMAYDLAQEARAVPIEPGSQELAVTVEIVYGIDQ